jgi:hypothetical protein
MMSPPYISCISSLVPVINPPFIHIHYTFHDDYDDRQKAASARNHTG